MRALLIAILLLATPAVAHDHGRPELNGWFQGLKSRANMPCCDGSDGVTLDDPDWRMKADNSYEVVLNGRWVDVPPEAIVEGHNRAGHAVVWPMLLGGVPTAVRCFMPGPMT